WRGTRSFTPASVSSMNSVPWRETEVRGLLLKGWKPPGVRLPDNGLSNEEALAAILRITGGNFRLLDRLLTQISRVLRDQRDAGGHPCRRRGGAGKPGHWHAVKRLGKKLRHGSGEAG